jgi:transposase
VLVWDDLAAHNAPQVTAFFEASAHSPTVFYLPSYALDLNPQKGIWAQAKRGIGNLAAASVDDLAAAVKHRLKKIRYRPRLIDACLTRAGMSLENVSSRARHHAFNISSDIAVCRPLQV